MPALPFHGMTREKTVSLGASILVNLAMIAAFASIANIDGDKVKDGAALVVIGLTGAEPEGDEVQEAKPASLPAPSPAAEPAPPTPAPDFVRLAEQPLEPKIALLQRPEPVAERSDAAPAQADTKTLPSPDQMREAAEQQRKAQEAARARAADQARAEARAAAAASERAASQASARAGGSGSYGAVLYRHLMRSKKPNTVGAGATRVRLTIDGGGAVLNVSVARSSGSASFDREALKMVRRAAPFPKPPLDVGRVFEFLIEGQ